ncbi:MULTISPECIES: 3D-(3,5/4)-trihydroxycyclohexane-1,2-dione acylhydrolase (decyclizing) [Streptomyces]|uniref:3D-(3,5/4)-trihydroxycyclohexane-1,2-dione acylhydrolase (decyclizing) n=1 Tax=Streptomyces TaxID=1883 RepID=UPI00081B666A|nr:MULTISPECIES: 3D-(3,5/4)-trihydroxycyclohexane-1,2-dione acylhydrolase (decyclizing) [Streptomyces]MYX84019.1 3D-(3,5/4)-trihydroxycyclohexane-1,2-dione acylhydrolase (decyclizing) [Streptomyces sp. SID4915]CAI4159457.1 3D-(3,5/4)-trihydroxycyclohexane-1,2-dione acylhydrolase (decyclizing) [Streptomyces albidoflavus]SCD51160.1 3D-(3,5/4)-trihydroxycyclohexane-1,2-dione hydrolase [Streptomyces sp. BvitLS-983]
MRLTTAQALIRFLSVQYSERDGERQRLIPAVWGVFGHGNVAGLGQALAEHTAERPDGTGYLRFHQGRSEQAMVHAATGFARQSRRLAAHAVTTSIGPGATNLVTGAALATVNRLPVLLLPGDTFATRPADPVLQQLELPYAGDITVNDCLRPVSRHFDRVTRPEALIPAALTAMRVLTDPAATGAVTLALPQDVQAEAYDWPEEFFAERTWHIRRPAPDTASLTEAAALLRAARRPLVVAGGGVKYAGAEAALDAFARATGIPVAATQAGKGALPHDHPQDVGALGHTGTATADDLARTADLVLAVGTRLTDFTTASGTLFAADGVRFAHLNLDPADAHKLAAHAVVGDAREGLTALTGLVGGHRLPDAHVTAYTAAKADWEARVDAAYAAPDPTARPTQTQLLGALDALVTGEDILVNAAGSLPGDLHRLWRARSADQYHVEYGYSCMGYEIPGALGILLADPHRPVWALVGDGTYLMNPTELVTAVQESLPLKLVLVDNHGYASIGGLSRAVGAEGFGTAYRMPGPGGLLDGEPLPLDLAANAASLGVRMLRAETVAELGEALAEVRTATVPTGVYVRTETPDTVSSPTPAQAWWDVPVARTAHREEAARARQEYDRNVAARRRHL